MIIQISWKSKKYSVAKNKFMNRKTQYISFLLSFCTNNLTWCKYLIWYGSAECSDLAWDCVISSKLPSRNAYVILRNLGRLLVNYKLFKWHVVYMHLSPQHHSSWPLEHTDRKHIEASLGERPTLESMQYRESRGS